MSPGIEPQFENFSGTDLVAFALSGNLHRRHMTPGQQAAAVAGAQNWAETLHQGGKGSNQHSSKGATLPPFASKPRTVADRAALSGVSRRTQKMADKFARADLELGRQYIEMELDPDYLDLKLGRMVGVTPGQPLEAAA